MVKIKKNSIVKMSDKKVMSIMQPYAHKFLDYANDNFQLYLKHYNPELLDDFIFFFNERKAAFQHLVQWFLEYELMEKKTVTIKEYVLEKLKGFTRKYNIKDLPLYNDFFADSMQKHILPKTNLSDDLIAVHEYKASLNENSTSVMRMNIVMVATVFSFMLEDTNPKLAKDFESYVEATGGMIPVQYIVEWFLEYSQLQKSEDIKTFLSEKEKVLSNSLTCEFPLFKTFFNEKIKPIVEIKELVKE